MTITLPDAVRAVAEANAKVVGRPVEEYVADLILADDPDAGVFDAGPGPAGVTFQTREELERLLDEGMKDQPFVIADAAFWAAERQRLRDRAAKMPGART